MSTATRMSSSDRADVQRDPIRHDLRSLPLWLIMLGNLVMVVSLWLLGTGGMVAKLVLLTFWLVTLLGFGWRGRISRPGLAGAVIFSAMMGVICIGAGDASEKLRLVGNLMMLPVGLCVGRLMGRSALLVMLPALVLYLAATSSFYLTHEGARLTQPFLFLGLFALCTVASGRATGIVAVASAGAVMLSQTRIAVLAMMINLFGWLRWSRAMTWLCACVVLGIAATLIWFYLPRLLMTHDSGRLVFWQDFAEMWWAASSAQKWLGFGTGSVEAILSQYRSFASFGALHNDHFRILFETGISGAVLWGAGWLIMIWNVRHRRLSVCILLSVMVTMVTDNTLNYGHYLICCGIAAGIASRPRVHHA
jgi:hypothetical protein